MKHICTTVKKLMRQAFKQRYEKFNVDPARVPVPLDNVHANLKQYAEIPEFFYSDRQLSQLDRANWYGAPPEMIEFNRLFYNRMQRSRIPMYPHCIYRTEQEQEALVRKGNSKLLHGPHNRSCATDWVHTKLAWGMNDDAWELIGVMGKEIARQAGLDIIWGGDWDDDGIPVIKDPDERFWDPAHWQLRDWRSRPVLPPIHQPVRRTPLTKV